jgi:anti-anti-sigma factor
MTPFSVRLELKEDKRAQVAVVGAIDAHNFEEFFKAISQLIDAGTLWIVLDFREMHYITSVGMNYLVNLRLQRRKAGGDMILVKPPREVLNVLHMIGFLEVLVVADTVEEAWAQIKDAKAPPGESPRTK